MRPLKLKLTAFGPYKKTEEIDFADLQGNQLFVISGSTGAGKTTIFDGICFALYGSASGSDRSESRILRSDFADDGTHTCVEMEFEIHNKRYRILRQMGHVKKGNKSATGERYEFFEQCEDGEKPCVERQIVSEINRRVEEILGLTQNQFSQIVMLPQGEFRKLLTSETDNKEEILRRIFKTEPYKMISERLKQKKDAAKDAYQLEEQVVNGLVRNAISSLPKRESELFEIVSRDHYNINQVLAGLQAEVSYYKGKISADDQRQEGLYHTFNKQMDAYHEAKKWNGRFEELAEKENRFTVLNEQQPVFAEKERRLQQAKRAGYIENIEDLFKELQENELDKKRLLKEAETAQQKAQEAKDKAEDRFGEQDAKSGQRVEAQETVIRLQNLLPQVRELALKQTELEQLQSAVRKAEKELREAEQAHAKRKAERDGTAEAIGKIEESLEVYDEKQEQLTRLAEQVRIAGECLAVQNAKEAQEKNLEAREAVLLDRQAAYKALEAGWFESQAHILAGQLHDGEACPVCGSMEHPAKQKATGDPVVSKEELEAAKLELDKVDGRFRDTSAKLAALKEQLSQKEAELESRGINNKELEREYDRVEKLKLQAEQEVRLLQSQKAELRELKGYLNEQAQQAEELEKEKAARLAELNKQNAAFEAAEAVVKDKLTSIPENMRELPLLEAEVQQALERREQLDNAWKAAQKEFQQAKERLASALVSLENAKDNADEMRIKREKAERQFKEALEKSAFESEEAYQWAKMKETDIAEWKEDIQEFNQTRHTLQQQIRELSELLKGQKKEDLSEMELQLAELKGAYEQALSELNHSKECGKKAEELVVNIGRALEKTADAEQQLNRIADLHDMIRGQNSLKISFERYLQIEYLEQIIQAANERLRNLSNGQFYLIRSDRQEARGKQSGLGLDVYDSYTGQTRDVKTLSGGEKFNASLCLALGMADVIQSFQGNVSIDTMFIDEGFGSLDEESLNKSIETLIDLQKSGRMIGVISHVQELKSAIPAILEVKKSKEGFSRTQFLIK